MTKGNRVLVVEDEAVVRTVAVDTINEAGFEAFGAASAEDGIRALEQYNDFSTVFTDIDLKGSINGLKFAATVNWRWPRIDIIIVSGVFHLREGDVPPRTRFISKPYRQEDLIAMLRSPVVH